MARWLSANQGTSAPHFGDNGINTTAWAAFESIAQNYEQDEVLGGNKVCPAAPATHDIFSGYFRVRSCLEKS